MARKRKYEVLGETLAVALHGFIKSEGWHTIEGPPGLDPKSLSAPEYLVET